MDGFAHHYESDWWYMAHHAMAISEMGRLDEARHLTERSLALNPRNGWAAHSRAHIAYESNEPDGARPFLAAWLPGCPRTSALFGHLTWHLAISELAAGNNDAAMVLFNDAVAPGVHQGLIRTKIVDAAQFLWRWELAGNPPAPAQWHALDELANSLMPRAGHHFVDLHIAVADAATGNTAALDARLEEATQLARDGRYPTDHIIPDAASGIAAFARRDYAGSIAKLEPFVAEPERLGGSRAQLDLIVFTAYRACIESGRHDDLQRLMALRRAGPASIPVAGLH